MKFPSARLRVCFLTTAAAAVLLASCSSFYTQAFKGQREIFKKAKPVSQVLADPSIKPALRQRLELVRDMLLFAEKELHLPAKDQYQSYADIKRPYVVWVVYAAPEFSTESHTWWYPIVGRLKYRGFFREEMAQREAEHLRKQGLDVYVSGVAAYSTLGYFRDPLLNTFLGRAEGDLAELIFHELTHQRLYLKGDTDFNEAFATAVGQEGAKRWLKARGNTKELALYERDQKISLEFVKLVLQTREELHQLYQQPNLTSAQKRASKAATIETLRQRMYAMNRRHGGTLQVEKWFSKPVNNARLGTLATYHTLVPGFEALLARHDGRLDPFFDDVHKMESLTKEQRAQRLQTLAAGSSRD